MQSPAEISTGPPGVPCGSAPLPLGQLSVGLCSRASLTERQSLPEASAPVTCRQLQARTPPGALSRRFEHVVPAGMERAVLQGHPQPGHNAYSQGAWAPPPPRSAAQGLALLCAVEGEVGDPGHCTGISFCSDSSRARDSTGDHRRWWPDLWRLHARDPSILFCLHQGCPSGEKVPKATTPALRPGSRAWYSEQSSGVLPCRAQRGLPGGLTPYSQHQPLLAGLGRPALAGKEWLL